MNTQLVNMLHLTWEPVGVFFGNTTAACDFTPSPNKRNCVLPLLMSASRGKIIGMDEAGCTCPGGAVGVCFGDGYTRGNPNIHRLLSQGMGTHVPEGIPEKTKEMMREGERFFCDEEVGLRWKESTPFSDRAYPRIVFAPLHRWEEVGTPDLVYLFANPDQISVLVTMLGFHNGKRINTLAPFGAACQSILYAAGQLDQEEPCAIMGLFDISQRRAALKDCLSLTLPYRLWENLHKDLDKSCLTTHSWRKIEKRL